MTTRTYGDKYDTHLTTAEIAARVRADVKASVAAGRLPKGTYSVRCGKGRRTIYAELVTLKEPMQVARDGRVFQESCPAKERYSDAAQAVLRELEGILWAYNHDASDLERDLHDKRFSQWTSIHDDLMDADKALLSGIPACECGGWQTHRFFSCKARGNVHERPAVAAFLRECRAVSYWDTRKPEGWQPPAATVVAPTPEPVAAPEAPSSPARAPGVPSEAPRLSLVRSPYQSVLEASSAAVSMEGQLAVLGEELVAAVAGRSPRDVELVGLRLRALTAGSPITKSRAAELLLMSERFRAGELRSFPLGTPTWFWAEEMLHRAQRAADASPTVALARPITQTRH